MSRGLRKSRKQKISDPDYELTQGSGESTHEMSAVSRLKLYESILYIRKF